MQGYSTTHSIFRYINSMFKRQGIFGGNREILLWYLGKTLLAPPDTTAYNSLHVISY